jgi:two-component system cell cycle response regulator
MTRTERQSAPRAACILVVDDNALNCELLEAMLIPQGYQVEQAISGTAALDLAERVRPDMILLDVAMPEMDGFEVARRLRQRESTRIIPIVMVTALGELEHRLRGLESGADDYLAKPITQAELLARVQSSLRLSYLRRQVDERQKLEWILGDTSDGILIVDATGRVREASPSARRMLGLDKKVDRLEAAWGSLSGAPEDLVAAIAAGEPRDFVLEREAPALFLRAILRPVRDPEGGATGAVLSLRNITRESLEHKLEQDVLSLVNHKLRTPLTVVTSWTQVLLDGSCGALDPVQREALESVAGAADKLRTVLDRMLAYLDWTRRLEHLRRRPVRFTQLARALRERFEPRLTPEQRLSIEAAPEGTVVTDADLCVEALSEVVRNALKFGGESVNVRVTMRRERDVAVVEIADDGPGIPPEQCEKIFEPFYQFESEFTGQVRGLGLGLAMARRAMNALDARIEVHSQLQQGTRFTIRF